MRTARVAAATAVAVLFAGCAGRAPLADDPSGLEACERLQESTEQEADVEAKVGLLLLAGKAAVKSDTRAIRDAVEEIEGLEEFPVVDVDELTAACEDAGVEIP